ncbi:MAG TPA: DNA-binding response regulator [Bacteroidales bacterium]|nr:DNA-binding response regulator [Bacteroidales bacterium]
MPLKIIIIDDEKPATDLIIKYLEGNNSVTVAAVCHDGFAALKACQEHQPDLLFLDIQMPKLTGFELLEVLDPIPAIIFTTAYDQFAIKAFDLRAIDYLLKPFSLERFTEALEKARFNLNKKEEFAKNIKTLTENRAETDELERIVVKQGKQIHVIDIEDMVYLEADGDYVRIVTEKAKFLKENTLKFYETKLDGNRFVRIHRSRILNVEFLDKIELYEKESYLITLKTGEKIMASLTGYKLLKELLKF